MKKTINDITHISTTWHESPRSFCEEKFVGDYLLIAYPNGAYSISRNYGGVYFMISNGKSSELSDFDPLGGIYEAERAAEVALEILKSSNERN